MSETRPVLIKPTNLFELWKPTEMDNLISVGAILGLSIIFIYCLVNIVNYIKEIKHLKKELSTLKGVAIAHIMTNVLFLIISGLGIALFAYSLMNGIRVEIIITNFINYIK